MLAVTYHGPRDFRVEEHPDPEPVAADDAVVRVETSGVCGSDLHIYHGRVVIEDGFIMGHEFVGTIVAVGDAVTQVAVGDRVLGSFFSACGSCWFCRRGIYQKCDHGRIFGHGAALGNLQGTQAELALIPNANFTLRRVPEGLSNEAALFAGDVMATGYHGVVAAGAGAGDTVAVIGCGPVGLCSVMAALLAGAARVLAIDMVDDRLERARALGAEPLHLENDDAKKAVRGASGGRGADVVVECVGSPEALGLAISLARKAGTLSLTGVFAERVEVHMGLAWIKSLNVISGHANVIGHLDSVLALMESGRLDPTPLVTHHMPLSEAAEAYRLFDAREALKIVLETG